jgi:V8-like Glu-specific endopeptidase
MCDMFKNLFNSLIFLVLVACFWTSPKSQAQNKHFISTENIRQTEILNNSNAVAAMVLKSRFYAYASRPYISNDPRRATNLCPEHPLYGEKAMANCSAFLIHKRFIVTAGHCVRKKAMPCKNYGWLFGYKNKSNINNQLFNKNNFYSCKSVVKIKSNKYTVYSKRVRTDIALIELDREVTDRVPLDIDFNHNFKRESYIYSLGFPLGTSMKLINGQTKGVFFNSNFYTNQISLPGSSGAPVIDIEKNKVIGILNQTFKSNYWNANRLCNEFKPPRQDQLYRKNYFSGGTNMKKLKRAFNKAMRAEK